MTIKLCLYQDGVCSECGHATDIHGLIRPCRPDNQTSMSVFVPPPTLADIQALEAASGQPVESPAEALADHAMSEPDLARNAADAPGFLTKVKNFAVAAAGHVAAGMPLCSDEEIIRRHDICQQCEHLKEGACALCGCPVSRAFGYVSKLSWADQECPAGKWGRVK